MNSHITKQYWQHLGEQKAKYLMYWLPHLMTVWFLMFSGFGLIFSTMEWGWVARRITKGWSSSLTISPVVYTSLLFWWSTSRPSNSRDFFTVRVGERSMASSSKLHIGVITKRIWNNLPNADSMKRLNENSFFSEDKKFFIAGLQCTAVHCKLFEILNVLVVVEWEQNQLSCCPRQDNKI